MVRRTVVAVCSTFNDGIASPGRCAIAERSFRWVSLRRTWIIDLTLLALPPYLLYPTIGPHIMPLAVTILVFFSTFLVSAWLGCRSPKRRPIGKPSRILKFTLC
jgi:hypothetical protein